MWETLADGEYVLFTRPCRTMKGLPWGYGYEEVDGIGYQWQRDGEWIDQGYQTTFDHFESDGPTLTPSHRTRRQAEISGEKSPPVNEKNSPGMTMEQMYALWNGNEPSARSTYRVFNYPPMWETLVDGEYVLFTRPVRYVAPPTASGERYYSGLSCQWQRDGKWIDMEVRVTFDNFESYGSRPPFSRRHTPIDDENYLALCEWDRSQKSVRDIGGRGFPKRMREILREFGPIRERDASVVDSKKTSPKP